MKQLALNYISIILLLTVSCTSNSVIADLQNMVLGDIQNKLESQGENIEAQSLSITHISGNEYIGVLKTVENGQYFSYTVNITYDGNSYVWEIPPSVPAENQVDSENNVEESNYVENDEDYSENYKGEDHKNMMEAMKNISDPAYCSLCKGTGIEENRARGMGLGDDEFGRVCPMCNGTGRRSY